MDVAEALEEWMARALPRVTEERRHAIAWRLGWRSADPPPTLRKVGERLGLSVERVRYLEQQAIRRMVRVRPPDEVRLLERLAGDASARTNRHVLAGSAGAPGMGLSEIGLARALELLQQYDDAVSAAVQGAPIRRS